MRPLPLLALGAIIWACGGHPAGRKPAPPGPPLASMPAATDREPDPAEPEPATTSASDGEPDPRGILDRLAEQPTPTSPLGADTPVLGTRLDNALVPVAGNDPEALEVYRQGHHVAPVEHCPIDPERGLRITPRVEQGEYPVGALGAIAEAHKDELEFCYSRELARKPAFEGGFTVKLIINAGGQVQMAAVRDSTIGNTAVENCSAQAARRWTFPKPPAETIVVAAIDLEFAVRCPEESD